MVAVYYARSLVSSKKSILEEKRLSKIKLSALSLSFNNFLEKDFGWREGPFFDKKQNHPVNSHSLNEDSLSTPTPKLKVQSHQDNELRFNESLEEMDKFLSKINCEEAQPYPTDITDDSHTLSLDKVVSNILLAQEIIRIKTPSNSIPEFIKVNIPIINSVYIKNVETFQEIEDYVQDMVKKVNLNHFFLNKSMRGGLFDYGKSYPECRAIYLGTRVDDPYGKKVNEFKMCDPGWPRFMRVSPILKWTYADVWTFIRRTGVIYCNLYDHGYTSLGDINSTKLNPALLKDGIYLPAWKLADPSFERSGRL
ncbi:FAD synthase [Smittium mucronatum]|uniref:FAD synthase n=1 Tax=Smittium mucronatum TaxID=133383 RepID=A0A1R0H9C0_9FUNG|nr:FAD synthase [Smittium mucronatum]